ncbi:endonuclease/exonuclease/phosphatase family protein [Alteromonadaceae bacterium M269]|nr:endonuclease/exonuclease/phosphatase family protein [Alteromonadaceae bacterium M269]
MYKLIPLWILLLSACSTTAKELSNHPITVATFNVSMEARNYVDEDNQGETLQGSQLLMKHLADGNHPQISNIAEIIQRTKPDIILLNEFDFIDNPKHGIRAFIDNYLSKANNGSEPINYPYFFYAQSNTGLPTSFDLDNNGKAENFGADAQGFGLYTGHYGMVLLSKYPIVNKDIRTFQRFLWSDMLGALKPITPENKEPFYNDWEWENLRLSSKSHWDIPVDVNGEIIRVLASHPTPPVFDGPEDRNGKRNHDEIRFWLDYITPQKSTYIYDDRGIYGGLNPGARFVILGDQNASPDRVNDTKPVISELLASSEVNNQFTPQSEAGKLNRPDNPYGKYHTASWGARADYVIPSKHFTVINGGVFWPTEEDKLYRLVKDRASSSDHRLVWLQLAL